MKNFTFLEKERCCEYAFLNNGPYWHIATPGALTEIIFTCDDDYRFGMTLIAESTMACGVHVYNFELMSNHLHIIGSAQKQQCTDTLDYCRRRLVRMARLGGRTLSLDSFVSDPLPIDTLDSLRNNIVYVSRNGFVVNSAHTPYSYPWGSGHLLFGPPLYHLGAKPYSELFARDQRILTRSRSISFPSSYTVRDGYITPESFVDYRTGMSFFRDAHQYFQALTKNIESYSEFAGRFGDMIVLTDEEMYSAAASISRKQYNQERPLVLPHQEKLQLAKELHFKYNATNGQINRILKIGLDVLQELFPKAQ